MYGRALTVATCSLLGACTLVTSLDDLSTAGPTDAGAATDASRVKDAAAEVGPAFDAASTSDAGDAGDAGDAATKTDAAPADAAVPTSYTGTLATTDPLPFGGEGYCNYKVTFSSVTVDLAFDAAGALTSGSASFYTVETIVGSCPYPPAPSGTESYVTASPTPTAGGLHIPLASLGTNHYVVNGFVETAAAPGASTMDVVLDVHRTDVSAPLDWHPKIKLTLSRH